MREFKVKKNVEKIKIGEEVFKIDLSDKSIENFGNNSPLLAKILNEYRPENDNTICQLKGICEKIINSVYLDEPFNDIYKICGESVLEVASVIVMTVETINELIAEKSGKIKKLTTKK